MMIEPVEQLAPAPDEDESRPLLSEEQLRKIRGARNKTRIPESLDDLAIKAVAKHCTRFIDIPDSPLKYLPNTVVQKFFSMIASDVAQCNSNKKQDKLLIPLAHLTKVLSLLVNPFVTELNCTAFRNIYSYSIQFNEFLLKHALENCPKISRIEIWNIDKIKNYGKNPAVPVQRFKKSWNDLKSIKTQIDCICNEGTLKLILENFPNIEELCIRIAEPELSQASVDHFKNMKRLHTLEFLDFIHTSKLDFIITIAGEVPSLQNFSFNIHGNHNKFIEEFAEKFPQKELQMNRLDVKSGLKKRWPKNLTVQNLFIVGPLNVNDIEYLSTIQGELKLTLDYVAAEQMYQLLERMGQLVKALDIEDSNRPRQDIVYIYSGVIVERILAACPNLEHFIFSSSQVVTNDDIYNLPPAAFTNYKEFYHSVGLEQLYKKILIGSKVCEKLWVRYYDDLEILVQVVRNYPMSLPRLVFLGSFLNDANYYEPFDIYLKCYYELLTSCHTLKKIYVSLPEGLLELELNNRYLAAIKAIDPDAIEFYVRGTI